MAVGHVLKTYKYGQDANIISNGVHACTIVVKMLLRRCRSSHLPNLLCILAVACLVYYTAMLSMQTDFSRPLARKVVEEERPKRLDDLYIQWSLSTSAQHPKHGASNAGHTSLLQQKQERIQGLLKDGLGDHNLQSIITDKSRQNLLLGNASRGRLPSVNSRRGGRRQDGDCPGLAPPQLGLSSEEEDAFQPVQPGYSYVLSAYYDSRNVEGTVVRVIGLADTSTRAQPRFCQLWYHDNGGTMLKVVPVLDDIIPETHGMRFAGFLYSCLTLHGHGPPYAVSLVIEHCETPKNVLVVKTHAAKSTDDVTSVCIAPVNKHFNDVNALVEFVEVNRLFGADRFIFYNYSTGQDVDRILKKYKEDNVAEVIQWKMPQNVVVDEAHDLSGLPVNIHYYAQLVSLNDCLYRSLHLGTAYIAFLDLDEFIIPRAFNNWKEIMKSSFAAGTCSVGFQNIFFRIDYKHDLTYLNDSLVNLFQLRTLLVTEREQKVWAHHYRSKYIASAKLIEMAGIHFPFKCSSRSLYYGLDNTKASLHHYRLWLDNVKPATTIDRFLHKFRDQIVDRRKTIQSKWKL